MLDGMYCKVSDYSKNLVSLLVQHASTRPKAIALRHKKIGLWQTWTWEKLLALSERYAFALQEYSFQKEQSLVIICSPNVDVIAISLAVQALGGRVQLIDQSDDTLQTDEILEHLSNLKPNYLLIEQLEQLVSLEALNYHPTYIFYIEQNHLHHFDHEYVISLATLFESNKSKHQASFKNLIIHNSDVAFSFTQIKEGHLQTVHFSHEGLIKEAEQLIDRHQIGKDEQAFIARSFSSVGQIRFLWSVWLLAGFCLNIPETLRTRDQDRQVISPTLVLGTQATYERVHQRILQRLPQSKTRLHQIYQHAIEQKPKQKKMHLVHRLILSLFNQVILEELGFARLKTALVVGDQVSKETQLFYESLGVQLQYWGESPDWRKTEFSEQTKSNHLLSSSTLSIRKSQ